MHLFIIENTYHVDDTLQVPRRRQEHREVSVHATELQADTFELRPELDLLRLREVSVHVRLRVQTMVSSLRKTSRSSSVTHQR